MFLKRLESIGFKSFAQRINIEFVKGVTAVVGPNGSGKSNVSDAIRWVLGEQSVRSLRGEKMEDIIFQGSESRKPLNVAEVNLTLDNSEQTLPLDYQEISIMRRVYRSGESEFFINKQACRLKDIVDLFMGSGLGKEAFSIISQGKVEEILSSKAEERRVIFEEAAGVLKYKQRKRKSEFKLAETEENLYRVDDIIYEIEKQINPLQHQSEIAETYLELIEELKEKEISLLVTQIEEIYSNWEALLKQIENEKLNEIKQTTAIQREEAELEKGRIEIDELDKILEKLQVQLLKATTELEQYEGKKQVYIEREIHVKANKEKLQAEINNKEEAIKKQKKQLNDETEQLVALRETRKSTLKKIEDLNCKLSTTKETIKDEIEHLKSIYIEKLNEQAALRNEKQSIKLQIQQLISKKNKHSQENEQVKSQQKELEKTKNKVVNSMNKLEELLNEKQTEIDNVNIELKKKRIRVEKDQTKLYQDYQQIEKMKSRQEMLEELKEEFHGFFLGVKAILKARDQGVLKGIHGAIIELIDIPKELLTAIETVLGGQAQHIVVTNEQVARNAISYLRKTNNGRATFIPLDTIQPRGLPTHVLNTIESHDGYVGIAADMVKVDVHYNSIINYSMGNVILAKTLKDANELASLSGRRFRIVSLEGDVVNPGGSMSGGAKQKRNSSIFTREKDLQEVTEKRIEFERRAEEFLLDVNKQKETIVRQESEYQNLEDEVQKLQDKLQVERETATEHSMLFKSMTADIKLYQREQQQFNEDKTDYKQRSELLTKQLTNIETNLVEIQNKIDLLTKQENEFKDSEKIDEKQLHALQINLAEQDERIKYQQEKSQNIKAHLETETEQHQINADELSKLLDIEQMKESENDINDKIEQYTNNKEKFSRSIENKRSERQNKIQRISDRELELKQQQKQQQVFVTTLQQKEVAANRYDVELENRLSKLQTDYEITFERAKKLYRKNEEQDNAMNVVKDIKKQITMLGTVNLGAIDEYKRLSERYTFLTEQKKDLVEAKQTLYTAIAEMDGEMKRLFDETFNQIKREFTIVFKELFGGGYAELKLTDPSDLLNTGVDIIAQPPGKKLQQLGLLSGGERALTAIALLFSILRVRPVPFCVLDEVEAALDESNVVRFAKYVRSHSSDTQFIVITHRKATMEEADVLYGVTMQEPGVSRLVSVRLEETNELIEP